MLASYSDTYIASLLSIGLRIMPSLTILRNVAFVLLFLPCTGARTPLERNVSILM